MLSFLIPSNILGQFHLLVKKNVFGETVMVLCSTPVCNEKHSVLVAKLWCYFLDDALGG